MYAYVKGSCYDALFHTTLKCNIPLHFVFCVRSLDCKMAWKGFHLIMTEETGNYIYKTILFCTLVDLADSTQHTNDPKSQTLPSHTDVIVCSD